MRIVELTLRRGVDIARGGRRKKKEKEKEKGKKGRKTKRKMQKKKKKKRGVRKTITRIGVVWL